MTLVAAGGARLEKRLKRALRGEVGYVDSMRDLRRLARRHLPPVIVISTMLGRSPTGSGQDDRPVEHVPDLLRDSPASTVIMIAFSPSRQEIDEITNVYQAKYVDASKADMEKRLIWLIEQISDDNVSRRTQLSRRREH